MRLHRREFAPLPSPEEAIAYQYSPQERVIVEANRQRHFIGTPFKVASTIRHLVDDTGADEIMVTSMMYGRDARFRSYELLASGMGPARQTKTPDLGDFLPGLCPSGHRSLRPDTGLFASFTPRRLQRPPDGRDLE